MRDLAPRTHAASLLFAILATAVGLVGSCRTVPRSRPDISATPPPSAATPGQAGAQSRVPPPGIRVGLFTEAPRVSIGADGGVVVRGTLPAGGTTVERSVARATFVPVSAGMSSTHFRIQVASMADEGAARELADRIRGLAQLEPNVRWNAESHTHQIRVGDYGTREEALANVTRVERASGIPGAWIVEEPGLVSTGRIRLLETGEEYASTILLPARNDDFLSADGLGYRGVFEVRANDMGTLTVVNLLNLEDYLRGVVPNELSPVSFPQLEALKAQAVAARTYALRNLGMYEAKGYDICATPACQVYKGKSSEHPLATQAVEDTRGVTATYGGALINALYTSTCGGETEHVENIFEGPGPPAPYLRGVACIPEREAWVTVRTAAPALNLTGDDHLTRDAALLVALDVLEPRFYAPGQLSGFATDEELRTWVSRLVGALHRKGCDAGLEGSISRRSTFFRYLVSSLCWDERAKRLLAPADPDYLLRLEDRAELGGEPERLAAALLIQERVLAPFPNNTLRPAAAISRAHAVSLLAEAAERAGTPALMSGVFRQAVGGNLAVELEGATQSYPLDRGVRLFRTLEGSRLAASELTLVAGDPVDFILQNGHVSFLEGGQNRLSASADQSSRYYRWEVRMTPEDVARSVARFGSVGSIRDIRPLRLGVSGRVVELAVIGSQGELVLKGLKVRWGLGLRENLFVIDRETDSSGAVTRFVFTGKGWGHGVGLCQVGASGMAQAGATYDTILKHYYTGIRVGTVGRTTASQ